MMSANHLSSNDSLVLPNISARGRFVWFASIVIFLLAFSHSCVRVQISVDCEMALKAELSKEKHSSQLCHGSVTWRCKYGQIVGLRSVLCQLVIRPTPRWISFCSFTLSILLYALWYTRHSRRWVQSILNTMHTDVSDQRRCCSTFSESCAIKLCGCGCWTSF